MCGALNAIVERPEDLPTREEIGKVCIHCGTTIEELQPVHRSQDGEVVHQACFNDLNDEDAHFYEAPEEELVDEEMPDV